MRVDITQRDIDEGLRNSYTHDPICRALRRVIEKQFSKSLTFQVLIPNRDYIFIDGAIFDMPEEVREFIELFDQRKTVMPFYFDLDDLPEDFFSAATHKR